MLNQQLHDELAAFLKENYHEFDEESKCFFDEAYADYNDRVSDKDLGKILDSDDPEQALEEMLWDCYMDCEWQYRNDIVSEFLKTPEGSKYDYEEVDDELVEMWYFKVPEDHYFEQEVNVDIVVDTGDMNYDYTLNAVYPHYNGREDDEITMETHLMKDLEADSLDAVEIIMAIEDEYGIEIPDEEAEKMQTVGDLVRYVEENK